MKPLAIRSPEPSFACGGAGVVGREGLLVDLLTEFGNLGFEGVEARGEPFGLVLAVDKPGHPLLMADEP